MKHVNLFIRQKQTHRHKEQNFSCQGEGGGGGMGWEFRISGCKLLQMDKQQGPIV